MSQGSRIYEFLKAHGEKGPVSFHMPGHKGAGLYERFGYGEFLHRFFDYDITEIPGADNLFQTEGILKEAQRRYGRLYGAKKSYLLVNGTSGGILASVLAAVPRGGSLIMARNCHKSVFNALTLGEAKPIYAYPEKIEKYGISGAVSPAEIGRLLDEHPEAAAVILPSPNYYGICSRIREIAQIVHERGKVLIADEAHGAHLKFFEGYGEGGEMPESAVTQGADLVVNSIHKTLGSLTQSAVLHLNSDRVDSFVLEDMLQCVESTSPSYILMASLDISAAILEEHGKELIYQWEDNLDYFYKGAREIQGLKIMDQIEGLDRTKMNFSMGALGLMGNELEDILMKDYDIFMELVTGEWIMGMSGIGNTRGDFQRLLSALSDISGKYAAENTGGERFAGDAKAGGKSDLAVRQGKGVGLAAQTGGSGMSGLVQPQQPQLVGVPKTKRRVRLEDAEGLICASSIIPYPPGIPLICPGERIDRDAIDYVKALRKAGDKVIGVSEHGEILAGNC